MCIQRDIFHNDILPAHIFPGSAQPQPVGDISRAAISASDIIPHPILKRMNVYRPRPEWGEAITPIPISRATSLHPTISLKTFVLHSRRFHPCR